MERILYIRQKKVYLEIDDVTINAFVQESSEDWQLVKHSKVIGILDRKY